MQLRSVCWQATSRLAPCPMEAIQSSAIKGDLTSKLAPLAQWKPFNQAPSREILPRSSRPLPNGGHSIKRNQGRSYLEARAPCPMEAIQSSAIKRNQGRSHLEARAARPMERGAHERRVERRAHVLVRRRLEHSRLALKRHRAPTVVISRHQWPISGHQRPPEGHQRAVRGPSEGHQRAIRGHQRPPEVIRGHQQPSEVIRGPSTAIAPVRQRGGAREPRGTPGRPRAPTAAWALS